MTDPELFPKDATDATGAANAAVAASLPLDDPTDRGLAERGRVATGSVRQIPGPGGAGVVWDLDAWAFLDGRGTTHREPQPVAAVPAVRRRGPVRGGATASSRSAASTCPTSRSWPGTPAGS